MKRDKIIFSLLKYAILLMLCIIMLGVLIGVAFSSSVEKDRFGNKIELTKKNVIMGDGNVLTVEELIEVYEELHH